jgi:hypothetical protein
MIVLDTHVLSALMQQQPDAQVVAWLDKQAAESIGISTVTLFEARYGLALLASGRRKKPASPWPGAPPWPPATRATSMTCLSRWSTHGQIASKSLLHPADPIYSTPRRATSSPASPASRSACARWSRAVSDYVAARRDSLVKNVGYQAFDYND